MKVDKLNINLCEANLPQTFDAVRKTVSVQGQENGCAEPKV